MNATLYEGRYFAIVADETHGEFVRAGDELLVVPVTSDGDVVLAVEPSAAFEERVRVLPDGQAVAEEARADTARCDLQEEIGYRAGRLLGARVKRRSSATRDFASSDDRSSFTATQKARVPSHGRLYQVHA
jgi:hypothetical protein